MNKRNLVVGLALLLIVSIVFVGCGGKSDAQQIKDAINGFAAAFNSGDYAKCATYVEGMTETELAGVKQMVESIEVTKIEDPKVDGSKATVSVTLKIKMAAALGGASVEDTQDMALNKVDGKWKFSGETLVPQNAG